MNRSETTCRSCSAPIYMAETPKGRLMPVDRVPAPGGNVQLFHRPDGSVRCEVLSADAVTVLGPDAGLRYSHFATCPKASQHRRRA